MREITQRPWNERPEQADQTVAVLEALGFKVMVDFMDRKYDQRGVLISETFSKRQGGISNGVTEQVTVDYTFLRTYNCVHCVALGYNNMAIGLAADKYTHEDYHRHTGSLAPGYF